MATPLPPGTEPDARSGEDTEIGSGDPAFVRLGSNIRDLRLSAGLTLEAVGEAMSGSGGGLGSSLVGQLEAGKMQPGVLQALRLAGRLDSTLERLIEGVFWNPGEVARKPRERRPDPERMGGYFTVLPPGEPAFEEATEVAAVGDRAEVAAVIARNVRDARARRHLLQRDLGLADTSGVGLIESGSRQPELQGLLTIARTLEVPTEFLMRGMRWEPPDRGSIAAPGPPGRRHDFHANDAAVTRLWRDDLTAAEIAAEIGITRPSVEGIVRRLRARGIDLPSRTRGRRAEGARAEDDTDAEGRPASTAEDVGLLHDRIAANLGRHRLATGLRLVQLAEAAESSTYTVRRAEVHGHELRLTTVVRLAGSLRVPVAALTRGIVWDTKAGGLALEEADTAAHPAPAFGRRLGANIRRRRRRLGLSQEELADRTGIFRRHFSAIETGAALPRPVTLLILAYGLDFGLAELLAGTCDWYVRPLPPPEYAEGEGPPSKAERQERLLGMWGDGASAREIAEALDVKPSAVGGMINELRSVGIEVAYRHPPISAAQLSLRLRRRRQAQRRPRPVATRLPSPAEIDPGSGDPPPPPG